MPVQSTIAWSYTTLEVGTATTLAAAFVPDKEPKNVGIVGGIATVAGAIIAGIVAHEADAPIAGAYATHGGLFVGTELALVGALLDSDHRGPRFRKLALGLGLVGVAGGAIVGATRIPTESYAMPWMFAPLAGGFGGAMVMTVAQLAAPSEHASRNIVAGTAIGMGLGLVVGWLLAERDIGGIAPYEPTTAPRMITFSTSL